MSRIEKRFAALKDKNQAAFISFTMAGDPNYDASLDLMRALPKAGVDVIEIGMPFTDPMADGPAIQLAGQRAIQGGQTLKKTLDLVSAFRKADDETPVVLMGYYNPIFTHGVEAFIADAKTAGIDGLIVVDLPPEEDEERCIPARAAGLDFIRLATPTTDEKRLPKVLENTSGFVYYVSINGITGAATPDEDAVGKAVAAIKEKTDLPVSVGFGVTTPEQAAEIAKVADGVVVGSAIVRAVSDGLTVAGPPKKSFQKDVVSVVKKLANATKRARK